MNTLREQLAKALGLQKGGLSSVSGNAPANQHYYFVYKQIDPVTEEESTIFINFEEKLDYLESLITQQREEAIRMFCVHLKDVASEPGFNGFLSPNDLDEVCGNLLTTSTTNQPEDEVR